MERTCIAGWAATWIVASLAWASPALAEYRTFRSAAPIVGIEAGNSAFAPYPSTIEVSSLAGDVTDLRVTLHDVTHTFPQDMRVLLVGPDGDAMVLQAAAGGALDADGLTYTFDDDAPEAIAGNGPMPADGADVRPSSHSDAYDFSPIAPGPPYAQPAPVGSATLRGVFGGTDPNGTWSLYVLDCCFGDAGAIEGGWSLEIESRLVLPVTLALTGNENAGAYDYYPSTITIFGYTGVVTDVDVTLVGVTHTQIDDLGVLLVGPSGGSLVLQSGVGGSDDVNGVTYTFDDEAPAPIADEGPPPDGVSVQPSAWTAPEFSIGLGGDPVGPFGWPAPVATDTLASTFDGDDPNGTWRLYVLDCCDGEAGQVAGGWILDLEVPEPDTAALGAAALLSVAALARRRRG